MMPSSGDSIRINIPKISYIDFLKQIVDNINDQIVHLDGELGLASSNSGNEEIMALFEHVHEIKSKSALAAHRLQEISNDSDRNQIANTTLSDSGSFLKKLETLIDTVNELESELKGGEYDYYSIVADLLTDALEQLSFFLPFGAIPHVVSIKSKIDALINDLKKQIQWSFREIGPLVSSDPDANPNAPLPEVGVEMGSLSQVYKVVDVLGSSFRNDLLQRFAQLQLIPYEKAFKLPQGGNQSLEALYFAISQESLEKRFVWFRHLVNAAASKMGRIFPAYWCLPAHLFIEFSRRTKKHFTDVLKDIETFSPDSKQYVNTLLAALHYIVTFEEQMKKSFDVSREDNNDHNEDSTNSDTNNKNSHPEFVSIVEAFDSFLGPYVQLEREKLDVLMLKLAREEEIADAAGANANDASAVPVPSVGHYDSAGKMFEYIKVSMKRCSKFSTGITYLSLSREFRVCLHNYAETLKYKCPSPISAKSESIKIYQISPSAEVSLCRLVSTAEYCIDTIPSLEAKMKEHVKKEFENDVDFSSQIDSFADAISHTLEVMAAGIKERVDPALKTMRNMNWAAVESVGDDSKYTKEIFVVFRDSIPRIRSYISPVYFQTFCTKLASAFLDRLLDNVWKLKRIAKTGAGQLLLDLNGIKTFLTALPRIKLSEAEAANVSISKPYLSLVNSRINKIEVILKLVCTEDDRLEELFALLWPDGTEEDFKKIQGLKARISLIPLPSAVSTVGDAFQGGVKTIANTTVGRGAKGAVDEIKNGLTSGARNAVGGVRNVFGDFKSAMSGDLFGSVDNSKKIVQGASDNSKKVIQKK